GERASSVRGDADSDARRTREEAIEAASAHLAAVAQASAALLQRVAAIDAEAGALLDSLRGGAGRLAGDVAALDASMGELYHAAHSTPQVDDGDVDGARLVALNMALSGESRDATERYLAEHFRLSERRALIDEVYAAIES